MVYLSGLSRVDRCVLPSVYYIHTQSDGVGSTAYKEMPGYIDKIQNTAQDRLNSGNEELLSCLFPCENIVTSSTIDYSLYA